jgi:hypothetical protein
VRSSDSYIWSVVDVLYFFCNIGRNSSLFSIVMSLTQLRRDQGRQKTRITIAIKALAALRDEDRLSETINEDACVLALERLEAIDKLNCAIILEGEEQGTAEDVIEEEVLRQETEMLEAQAQLNLLRPEAESARNVPAAGQEKQARRSCHVNPPRLTLTRFCDNDADPFAFKNFLAHYENAVGGNCDLSDEQRMSYLRGALDGRAFQLIQS